MSLYFEENNTLLLTEEEILGVSSVFFGELKELKYWKKKQKIFHEIKQKHQMKKFKGKN